MYWSALGFIEGAKLDGSNRRTIVSLGESIFDDTIDARGLTLDIPMNRIYFVSYVTSSLRYIDLGSGDYSVQEVIKSFYLFYDPFGIAVDDQYVYWSEYSWFGWVFRINKTDYDDISVLLHGLYDPRGLAVKKGIYTRDSEYLFCTECTLYKGDIARRREDMSVFYFFGKKKKILGTRMH